MFFPFPSFSGFVWSKCPQPSFVVSHSFSWHVLTNGSLPDLDGTGFRACTMEKINEIFTQIAKFHYSCRVYPGSKSVSRRSPRQWLHILQKSQILNKSSAAIQPVLPHWKRMQLLSPVVPARQDPGTFLYMVTALQPLGSLGPTAEGHLMTVEIRGVDLIPSQAPKMNKRDVPFYYGSFCEQCHKVITKWIDNIWEESNMPAFKKPIRILQGWFRVS